jgi:hypothetical protein
MSMLQLRWSDRDYFAPRREGSGRPLDPEHDSLALGWLGDGHVMHVLTVLPRYPAGFINSLNLRHVVGDMSPVTELWKQ